MYEKEKEKMSGFKDYHNRYSGKRDPDYWNRSGYIQPNSHISKSNKPYKTRPATWVLRDVVARSPRPGYPIQKDIGENKIEEW